MPARKSREKAIFKGMVELEQGAIEIPHYHSLSFIIGGGLILLIPFALMSRKWRQPPKKRGLVK